MTWTNRDELREQGRSMVGALTVVGVTFVYTMETWWHGWQLPVTTLMVYDLAGLALVLAVTRSIGFRTEEYEEHRSGVEHREGVHRLAAEFAELIFQSFLVGFLTLFLFGIVKWGNPVSEVVRLGLILVVPLSFGAALSNALLGNSKNGNEFDFPRNVATFAVGAIFLASTIAPTQEVELMAARTGWWREAAIVVASLFTAYLMLCELDLQGQRVRTEGRGKLTLLGTAVTAYGVALVVTVLLLAAFGHLSDAPAAVWVQETVVLGFPATIGASAAQVVI